MSDVTRLLQALLNGEDIGNFEPKSRMEAYLKNCCLASGIVGLPEPITETDALLYQLAKKLGTGGGGAKEPYIEETYDADGNLIDVNLVGYTAIRHYAFYNCKNLALTSLPSEITSIGAGAFYNCYDLTLISLPSGITSIGTYTFFNCYNLALTSLPSGITSIGTYAFYTCSSLALTSLPSGLTNIASYAFRDCTGLTSITFHGKPSVIDGSAFVGCTNLKTINVPWASGEVANAPWGATNATINYNYTG